MEVPEDVFYYYTSFIFLLLPGDMFQEELAWVDIAQVIIVTLALRQLLQQVLVHIPGVVASVKCAKVL